MEPALFVDWGELSDVKTQQELKVKEMQAETNASQEDVSATGGEKTRTERELTEAVEKQLQQAQDLMRRFERSCREGKAQRKKDPV